MLGENENLTSLADNFCRPKLNCTWKIIDQKDIERKFIRIICKMRILGYKTQPRLYLRISTNFAKRITDKQWKQDNEMDNNDRKNTLRKEDPA